MAKNAVTTRIELENSAPVIWRRVLVPGTMRFDKLHEVIQAAMGWDDYHLHLFRVGDNLKNQQLAGNTTDDAVVARVVTLQVDDHANHSLIQIRRIPLRCRVLLVHDSNLSKDWSLQETPTGSAV